MPTALSVSQFIDHLNAALVTAVFPEGVAIEGEVAEYRVSQDKWIWFLLKDKDAVLPCFSTTWQMRTPLEDGMHVRVYGSAKVHPKSGKFSVVVERAEPLGEGSLKRAFELLKKALTAQGIFAFERKRKLPQFPEKIVLIASRESAAYTDFLRILGSRWGGITINLIHVQVQGQGAVADITNAFRYVNAHPELGDLVVLTRGGGSLEDLQAFNSEEVVRAIFGSTLPVVVGVGHERDETLADYVADVRASTPTNAAEIIVPDRVAEVRHLETMVASINRALLNRVNRDTTRVAANITTIATHLTHTLGDANHSVNDFRRAAATFLRRIDAVDTQVRLFAERAHASFARACAHMQARVSASERLLTSLDPRAILKRGYALVWHKGAILKSADQVDSGSRIRVQFAIGTIDARVEQMQPKEQQPTLL